MKKLTQLTTIFSLGSLVLSQVQPVLAQVISPGVIENHPGYAPDLGSLVTSLISAVMGVSVLLVFAYLVWGAMEWISAGGDSSKVEKARNKIMQAVIGLLALAASYAILQLALRLLGLGGLNNSIKLIKPIGSS